MHFRAVASVAAMTCVASASASFGSFYMASPVGMSLVRRDTDGYQPNSTLCDRPGNTCAQVCGSDYAQCASTSPDETHCFQPSVGESCCMDGSGNSCGKGFFCTNEAGSKDKNNWCCPDGMSLEDCAIKFDVKGRLQLAKPSTSSSPVPTPAPTSESSTTVAAIETLTTPLVKAVTNSTMHATSATQHPVACTTSSVRAPINNTFATQPVFVPSQVSPPSNVTISGASSSGVSSLLLVLAGFVAVM